MAGVDLVALYNAGFRGSGDNPGALRPAENDAAARDYIYANFGVMSYYLNDPEIGPLLMKAGYERWDATRLQTSLMGTHWWQSHSDAQRTYDDLERTDPSTLARTINDKQDVYYNMMRSMGVTIPDIGAFTRDALRNGYSDAKVQDLLAHAATMADALHSPGQIQTLFNKARDTAAAYLVKPNDQMSLEFARRISSGELDEAGMAGYFRDQATRNMPWLKSVIDQGVTLQQYFDPHKQAVAKLLEVSPDAIDLTSSKYRAITGTFDSQAKTTRAMTLTEAEQFARGQAEWKATGNARAMSANLVSALGQAFGVV